MLKIGFRLAIGIQHRVFVTPWVKRHSVPRILCLDQRDYNSPGLSRYVPKKSRKVGEDLTSQPVDGSEKGMHASSLDPRQGTFLDIQEKNDAGKYTSEPCDDSNDGIMCLEKGIINASRWDHSVLGSNVKGKSNEAKESAFLDLKEKNDAVSYMNESCADSNEGIMSLGKVINASRRDHSVMRSKVKGNIKEAGKGTFLHLTDKNDAGMYGNVSCDDSEVEESSNNVKSRGYKPTRQHKKAYDEVKLHMEAEQTKSSGKTCSTTQEAENMAIRYLGLRAYSAVELKKKLIGKKYPLEVVNRVINDFQHRGFINDSLYAESFSRSRWSSSSWGPRRIKQALFTKGISNKDSEAAIKLVFEKGQGQEGDEAEAEPEPKHGMSKEALDQLYVQVSKRWLQGRDLPIETRKARVVRWLQYRGFNWGVVAQLLKRLESTHES